MKIEIEIPDNLGEFLKAIGRLQKVNPETYLKEYVERYANDSVQESLDTLCESENPLFNVEGLEEAYKIKIRI